MTTVPNVHFLSLLCNLCCKMSTLYRHEDIFFPRAINMVNSVSCESSALYTLQIAYFENPTMWISRAINYNYKRTLKKNSKYSHLRSWHQWIIEVHLSSISRQPVNQKLKWIRGLEQKSYTFLTLKINRYIDEMILVHWRDHNSMRHLSLAFITSERCLTKRKGISVCMFVRPSSFFAIVHSIDFILGVGESKEAWSVK